MAQSSPSRTSRVNACPNPSLPAPPSKPRVQKKQIARKEASARSAMSVLNMARPRDTSRSSCLGSQSQNISASRRRSRHNSEVLDPPRRVQTPHPLLRRPSLKMNLFSLRRRRISNRCRNLNREPTTGQKARPRILKSDLPTGTANKNVCMK